MMSTMRFESDYPGDVFPDPLVGELVGPDKVLPELTTQEVGVLPDDKSQLPEFSEEDPADDIHPYYLEAEKIVEGLMTLFEGFDKEEIPIIRAMLLSQVIRAYDEGLFAGASLAHNQKKSHSHHGFQGWRKNNGGS